MSQTIDARQPMLILYYKDGSYAHIDPSYEQVVEAALARIVGEDRQPWKDDDSRDERDTLLRLRAIDGVRVVILASSLVGFSVGWKNEQATAKGTVAEPADTAPGADAHATGGE